MERMSGGHRYQRPLTTQETVLEELRWLISEGALLPGEYVRQDALAERLGVSRIPIREALRVLVTEGRVQHEPHKGYRVLPLTPEDLGELHILLRLLESEALRQAMDKMTTGMFERLASLLDSLSKEADNPDPQRFMALNQEFRFALFSVSGLRRLVSFARTLWQHSDAYRRSFMRDHEARHRRVREYGQVLEAIGAGDADAAISALNASREAAVQDILRAIASTPASDSQRPK